MDKEKESHTAARKTFWTPKAIYNEVGLGVLSAGTTEAGRMFTISFLTPVPKTMTSGVFASVLLCTGVGNPGVLACSRSIWRYAYDLLAVHRVSEQLARGSGWLGQHVQDVFIVSSGSSVILVTYCFLRVRAVQLIWMTVVALLYSLIPVKQHLGDDLL